MVINKEQSIEQTVNFVMVDLSKIGLEKSGKNKEQGYAYRTIDGAYEALSPILSKHGLLISANHIEHNLRDIEFGKYNTKARHLVQNIEYTIRHIHNKEVIVFNQIGEAIDTSDKVFNKSFTAAYKYMIINFFCIPVQGMDDADSNTIDYAETKSEIKIYTKSIPVSNVDLEFDRKFGDAEVSIDMAQTDVHFNELLADKFITGNDFLKVKMHNKATKEIGLKYDTNNKKYIY